MSQAEYDSRWDAIFGRDLKEEKKFDEKVVMKEEYYDIDPENPDK